MDTLAPDEGTAPVVRAPEGYYRRNGQPRQVLVDPTVSRKKFEQELAAYAELAADRRRLGWWLLSVEYPEVLVAFTSPTLRPAAVLFGALLDFTNYDLWPPSVTIVNPFTSEPLRYREIPPALRLNRKIQQFIEVPGLGKVPGEVDLPLLQAHEPDDVPFFCIPGVREYHEHPAHTGDSWLLHRGQGEGTLFFLLEKLHRYGVEPIRGFQFGLQVTGFAHAGSPE